MTIYIPNDRTTLIPVSNKNATGLEAPNADAVIHPNQKQKWYDRFTLKFQIRGQKKQVKR